MTVLLLLIVIWKSIDFIVSLAAPVFIPYLGFFSYGSDMLTYNVPDFVRALSNFDGIFYTRIATQGYSYTEQAFFPLYPLLIRSMNGFIGNPLYSGILISHLAGTAALFVFYKYLKMLYPKQNPIWILLFLIAYPTSYYLGVMYNESVFFLLFISTLYAYKKEHYAAAGVLGYLTALTRVIGVFVAIPIGFLLLQKYLSERKVSLSFTVLLMPLLGLGSYCAYLWKTVGDPFFFIHAQESFGAHRSSQLITPLQVLYRYLKIFVTADHNFQFYVAALEVSFFIIVTGILVYDLVKILKEKSLNFDRLGLNIFSFANILIPTLTGTFTSIPRYSLMSLSIFCVLGNITNIYLRYTILAVCIILHICLLALFIQGYYVT